MFRYGLTGICYGFNIMKESESVGHIFEIVRTRFEKGSFASRAPAARSVRCVLITSLVARIGAGGTTRMQRQS